MKKKLAAIILAAGDSTRMGRPKALLPLGKDTFLSRIVNLAIADGLDPVKIVVGRHAVEINEALADLSASLIINMQPELGQLSSLRLGLDSLPEEVDGAVVFLVDHPFVKAPALASLLEAFEAGEGEIVIPVYEGQRGHPVIFGRAVFEELFNAPLSQGARAVVRADPKRVVEVDVDDPGILADIDTPEAYEKALNERKND